MGTNYYWHPPAPNRCDHCGRADDVEILHIGKSSAGWCFSLHVIPEKNIHDLPDWQLLWEIPGSHIENEYGERVDPGEMLTQIQVRSHPLGLQRHQVERGRCLGPGAGTWDLVIGYFS